MPLTLTILNPQQFSSDQEVTKVIDQYNATIGRASDNDWVLQDPERILSRNHCVIRFQDPDYYIIDTSNNGVFHNHSEFRLERNQPVQLNDGDTLTLGNYQVSVSITAQQPGVSTEPMGEATEPFEEANILRTQENDLQSQSSLIFKVPAEDPFKQPKVVPNAPPTSPSAQFYIPEDANFLDPSIIGPVPSSEEAAGEPDHLPPEREYFKPPKAIPETSPEQEEIVTSAPPRPAGDTTVIQAFLEGAGLPELDLSQEDPLKLMRELGAMFRQSTAGLRDILIARNSIRREIGARDLTMLGPTGNNPLKFSVSVEDAMVNLLIKRGPAYLPPVQALEEGFDDIKAHEFAMLAGIKAALTQLLAHFNPETLKMRLNQHSRLTLLPGSRKAQYWDLFTELYADIAKEAGDDFQELFGREFARAYDEQLRKL